MEVLQGILNSQAFLNFVILPFAVVGFYQIFRGVTAIIEKDLSKHDWPSVWMVVAYLAVTLIGCICLFVAITKIPT